MTAAVPAIADQASQRIAQQILDFLSHIPRSREVAVNQPYARTAAIAAAARRKAFLASSSLALPPGPIGWLTVLPELVAVWRIQGQMVADIAAACGQHADLTREQMLYCLFRHAASQAVRDIAVRAGQRWLVDAASARTVRRVAERIGIRLSERVLESSFARMLPLAGALGVGTYAWYDTRKVARTSIELFTHGAAFVPAERGGAARRADRDAAQAAREAGL